MLKRNDFFINSSPASCTLLMKGKDSFICMWQRIYMPFLMLTSSKAFSSRLRHKCKKSHCHNFLIPDVDATEKCFAKMSLTEGVNDEILIFCTGVCVAAHICDTHCCFSFWRGVLNDNDTHPFYEHITMIKALSDRPLRRKTCYMLERGCGEHKTCQTKFFSHH